MRDIRCQAVAWPILDSTRGKCGQAVVWQDIRDFGEKRIVLQDLPEFSEVLAQDREGEEQPVTEEKLADSQEIRWDMEEVQVNQNKSEEVVNRSVSHDITEYLKNRTSMK